MNNIDVYCILGGWMGPGVHFFLKILRSNVFTFWLLRSFLLILFCPDISLYLDDITSFLFWIFSCSFFLNFFWYRFLFIAIFFILVSSFLIFLKTFASRTSVLSFWRHMMKLFEYFIRLHTSTAWNKAVIKVHDIKSNKKRYDPYISPTVTSGRGESSNISLVVLDKWRHILVTNTHSKTLTCGKCQILIPLLCGG